MRLLGRGVLASLLARAEKVDARDPRIKAGMGSILVRSVRPGEALRYFAQAEAAGLPSAQFAADRGFARLSVAEGNGEPLTLLAPAPPVIWLGTVAVTPPPGAFLQATTDAEAALQQAVAGIVGGASRVTDLFAGCGTLGLPLLKGLSRLTAAEIQCQEWSCFSQKARAPFNAALGVFEPLAASWA